MYFVVHLENSRNILVYHKEDPADYTIASAGEVVMVHNSTVPGSDLTCPSFCGEITMIWL